MIADIENDSVPNNLGRKTTCRYCSHKFRVDNKEIWKVLKFPCPSCEISYCVLPVSERDLMILQDDFFTNNRQEKYMASIYTLLKVYTRSLVLQNFSNLVEDEEDLEYYSHQACTFLIEKYYIDPDFKIETSFAAFLVFKIKQAIWGKSEHETAPNSLDIEDSEGHKIDYGESDSSMDVLFADVGKQSLKKNIMALIDKMSQVCDNDYENLMRLTAILSYLKGGEKYSDKLFAIYERTGKKAFLQTLDLIKSELQK